MTRTLRTTIILAGLGVLLISGSASADAGTGLLWAGMLHLSIGNALIGILEGILITRRFKVNDAVGTMILANYVSCIAGVAILYSCGFYYGRTPDWITIYNARYMTYLLWLASFVITVILEWPFCLQLLKTRERRSITALKASLFVNAASYAILIPWFWLSSHVALYGNFDIDRSLEFAHGSQATIYYISSADRGIYSVHPDGSDRHRMFPSRRATADQALYLSPSSKKGYFDLRIGNGLSGRHTDEETLLPRIAKLPKQKYDVGLPGLYHTLDLREADKRAWRVNTRFWAAAGLYGNKANSDKWIELAFETPFISWIPGFANVLPGDLVVYQMGGQILVVDLNRRKVGLLAMGRTPVAVP